jgi:phage tail protein X
MTILGDTWDVITYKLYGQIAPIKELMEANSKYLDTFIFSEGVILSVPEVNLSQNPNGLPPWRN